MNAGNFPFRGEGDFCWTALYSECERDLLLSFFRGWYGASSRGLEMSRLALEKWLTPTMPPTPRRMRFTFVGAGTPIILEGAVIDYRLDCHSLQAALLSCYQCRKPPTWNDPHRSRLRVSHFTSVASFLEEPVPFDFSFASMIACLSLFKLVLNVTVYHNLLTKWIFPTSISQIDFRRNIWLKMDHLKDIVIVESGAGPICCNK